MNRILIFSEPDVSSIKRTTLGILEKLDGYEIEIVIFGKPEQTGLDLFKQYKIKRISLLKGKNIKDYNPESYTHALHEFIKENQFDIVFSGATMKVQDIFPRLSTLFNTGLAAGVKDFIFKKDRLIGVKEIYGGKCLTDVEIFGSKPWLMTIKPGALNAPTRNDYYNCDIVDIDVADCNINATIYETENNLSERPPLENADIVIAGGRGLGDETKLEILEKLADTLGAAMGASGGAVGNDFAPKEYLVGQTGTQIAPLLYIACGISGAIQHLAGIRNAKRILAINPDTNAPLMRMANYAIVGKLEDIVPALTQQLTAKKNNGKNNETI